MKNTIKIFGIITIIAVMVLSCGASGGGKKDLEKAISTLQEAIASKDQEAISKAEEAFSATIGKTSPVVFTELIKDADAEIMSRAMKNATLEMISGLVSSVVSPGGDFRYELIPDNRGIRILGYTGNALIVNIPSSIEGYQVLEIGNGAFRGSTNDNRNNRDRIISITIPDGIERIGSDAFRAARSITSIVVPESVKEIEAGAFAFMTELTYAKLPDGLKVIPNSLFRGSRKLTTVNLPSALEEIQSRLLQNSYDRLGAFDNCIELFDLYIPESLTEIKLTYIQDANHWVTSESRDPTKNTTFRGCQKLPIRTRQRLQELGYEGIF